MNKLITTVITLFYLACGELNQDRGITLTNTRSDLSPLRMPDESYDQAEERYRSELSDLKRASYLNLHSVKSNAVMVSDLDFSSIPAIASSSELQSLFEKLRDERFMAPEFDSPVSPRRLTWLYPDDGCYARAHIMIDRMLAWNSVQAHKMFLFGELTVSSDYVAGGTITWWYHVAPVVSLAGTAYIIDPSVDWNRPLTVDQWLAVMGATEAEVEGAICSPNAYGPYSVCKNAVNDGSSRAYEDIQDLLFLEEQRLFDLEKSLENELGDSPVWSVSE